MCDRPYLCDEENCAALELERACCNEMECESMEYFYAAEKELQQQLHTPPQEYSMTAEGGALVPREWCIHSGEMVHGGRRRGAPSRHAGAYSGRALRLRMDSPSIWIVYAL